MELATFLVNCILVEKQPVAEVAAAHEVSRSWLYELLARYREGGEEALVPRSRRPATSPTRVSSSVEDEIVALRKSLAEEGLDAGPHTIHYHLQKRRRRSCPSVATIWRVLSRRGFVAPQPQKRPKSSYRRFQADLPNELWQTDTTHWSLADGSDVEILNMLDDHSRLLVASKVFRTTKAFDVVSTFRQSAELYGLPAAVLSDIQAVSSSYPRVGRPAA